MLSESLRVEFKMIVAFLRSPNAPKLQVTKIFVSHLSVGLELSSLRQNDQLEVRRIVVNFVLEVLIISQP